MSYFTADLKRAILTGELAGFSEVPPLCIKMHPVVDRKRPPTQDHVLDRHRDTRKDPGAGKGGDSTQIRQAERGRDRDDEGIDQT